MTDKFWRYLLITDSYMQWNLINLKCKIVPYTLLPILLPETSSVALFGACVRVSSEPDKTIFNSEEQPHRIEMRSEIFFTATTKSGCQ